jgi:hypothetical protein
LRGTLRAERGILFQAEHLRLQTGNPRDRQYREHGLAAIGASMDEDGWKSVRPFLARKKDPETGGDIAMPYPVVIASPEMAKQYNITSMPVTLLIRPPGKDRALAYRRRRPKELREQHPATPQGTHPFLISPLKYARRVAPMGIGGRTAVASGIWNWEKLWQEWAAWRRIFLRVQAPEISTAAPSNRPVAERRYTR